MLFNQLIDLVALTIEQRLHEMINYKDLGRFILSYQICLETMCKRENNWGGRDGERANKLYLGCRENGGSNKEIQGDSQRNQRGAKRQREITKILTSKVRNIWGRGR